MTLTRQYLRDHQEELNQKDAMTLKNLFQAAKCMHRRIIAGETYRFCGRGALKSVHGGKIIFCGAHREQ
jgi:hypothetical protein